MVFQSTRPNIALPNSDLTTVVLSRVVELGNRTALIDGATGNSITFTELADLTNRFAAGLHYQGFRQGDVLAIFCPNIPEYAVVFLGVAAAGGINTTVNSLYSTNDLIHQFKDSRATWLITVPAFLDRALPAAKACNIENIYVIGEVPGVGSYSELLDNNGERPAITINPQEDLVALPYSSGTTGLSKGVMLTHANLIANMVLSSSMNHVDENDSLVAVLPFFHIYGMVLILNLAIYRGAKLVTMSRFDLEDFLSVIQKYRITCLNLVPPLILALAKHPLVDNYDLGSVRMVSSGAAPLGEDLEQACGKRLNCQIYQGYGLTEVSGASHILPIAESGSRPGSIGSVLPNTLCKIMDTDSGTELGTNARGEVLLRGPHVMKGYLNNPEATAGCIDSEGWFHTGDIGYADEDGFFFIVDRVKELIKYKGYQVAPAELEALLLSHPAIADAAVIPSPDEEAGEIPKAFVVRREDISAEAIMKFVADQVAPHKKIRRLEFIDLIPKSASGKILRRVLIERDRK